MRAYGLPRHKDIRCPDQADLSTYALKSSTGTLPGKDGVCRGTIKNKRRKSATRRYFKRCERRKGLQEARNI